MFIRKPGIKLKFEKQSVVQSPKNKKTFEDLDNRNRNSISSPLKKDGLKFENCTFNNCIFNIISCNCNKDNVSWNLLSLIIILFLFYVFLNFAFDIIHFFMPAPTSKNLGFAPVLQKSGGQHIRPRSATEIVTLD